MARDSKVDIVLVGEGLMDVAIDLRAQTGTEPKLVAIATAEQLQVQDVATPPMSSPHDPFFTIYTSVRECHTQLLTT